MIVSRSGRAPCISKWRDESVIAQSALGPSRIGNSLVGLRTWNTMNAANHLFVAVHHCHRPNEIDECTDRRLVEPLPRWVDNTAVLLHRQRPCALWLPAAVPTHVFVCPTADWYDIYLAIP